ncbi:hypothetical protein BJX68DRAFT_271684 [Aspergillus pseudodeflectus]|jgi:hypothetical protein|uniref:Uncharacterized protein n=2 Tax=Aspergillus subgen. Nidulantes TaxID=2720870 RepID=A0A0U5G2Q7_ASPCI|nr:hypothetical protein ASPCAL07128 [Aspergillus calidoustus]
MSSPHQGGSLYDMAEKGTKIPNDAGLMNTIPSVPRPDQLAENPDYDYRGLGEPSTAFAADNPTDMPRSTRDLGFTGEVMTGTGNTFPAEGENAGNEIGANDPGAKGQLRTLKHETKNRSAFDRFAGEDEDAPVGEHEVRNRFD